MLTHEYIYTIVDLGSQTNTYVCVCVCVLRFG